MEGNQMKMREALSDACYAMLNFLKTQSGGYEEMANALDKAKAALSSPPRQCDVGTAEEQNNRYEHYCFTHRTMERCCQDCPIKDEPCCELAWAQMPYDAKEGGAK